jgi:hypothetical protein
VHGDKVAITLAFVVPAALAFAAGKKGGIDGPKPPGSGCAAATLAVTPARLSRILLFIFDMAV